jgi:hypothetical protein
MEVDVDETEVVGAAAVVEVAFELPRFTTSAVMTTAAIATIATDTITVSCCPEKRRCPASATN